jgi:DNA-binding MarR family transcriptional regulator
MGMQTYQERDFLILEQIEQNPDATQASLATQLGVAVGTVNWHVKRLVAKGFIKVRHAERRKLRYIITPEGLALRAHLTLDYIKTSFSLYRLVRKRMVEALAKVNKAGYSQIRLEGDGDVADVCRLTCLEQSVDIVKSSQVPLVRICDLKIHVEMAEEEWNVRNHLKQTSKKPK